MKPEKEASGLVAAPNAAAISTGESGDLALVNALVAEGVVTRSAVTPLLQRLQNERPTAIQSGQALTLLQLLVNDQLAKLDELLGVVVERSGLPYLPLATYDVDRDVACLVPREIAFEFCLIPFDRISRSVLVAVANPFDLGIRERIRAVIGADLFWYVSSPLEITTALRRAHDLDKQADGSRAKT